MPREIAKEGGRMPQLPVDPNVQLPPSVRRRAEAADALHAQAYSGGDAGTGPTGSTGPGPGEQTQSGPTGGTGPAPGDTAAVTGTTGPAEPDNWENRYLSMKGRFDASQRTIGAMQEQIQTLAGEVMQSTALLQRQAQQPQPQQRQVPVTQKRLTQQDIDTYGPELVDLVTRAAQDALAPTVDQLHRETKNVQQQTQVTRMALAYEYMDEHLPDWRIINNDPKFLQWLNSPDLYSGKIKKALLDDAVRAANAPRMLAFFKGFVSDGLVTGSRQAPPNPGTQEPAPPARQAATTLEAIAAPGKAKPAPGDTSPHTPPEKPIFTRAQIADFYNNVRKGFYNGRVEEYHRQQEAIFAAQREGRIR